MEGKSLRPSEQSMIIKALQAELSSSFEREGVKGCDPRLQAFPVNIEPPFQAYELQEFLRQPRNEVCIDPIKSEVAGDRAYLRCWLCKDDEFSWPNFEIVLRELRITKGALSFLFVGNCKRITFQVSVAMITPLKSFGEAMKARKNVQQTKCLPYLQALTISDSLCPLTSSLASSPNRCRHIRNTSR